MFIEMNLLWVFSQMHMQAVNVIRHPLLLCMHAQEASQKFDHGLLFGHQVSTTSVCFSLAIK